MATTTTKLVLAAAMAVAIAGCAKKRPAELPPAPQGTAPEATPQPTGPVGNEVVPGSREDFLRSVTSDTVHFGTDMSEIDSEARAILDTQVTWLQKFPQVRVTVEGHADERGTREYNLALGDRRASSAKNYLVSRGIDAGRVTTISYGKERPAATGSDESSWAQNRRAVTVTLQ